MKNLAVLTDDCINQFFFFYKKLYGHFAVQPKKVAIIMRWPDYRGSHKEGFHCSWKRILQWLTWFQYFCLQVTSSQLTRDTPRGKTRLGNINFCTEFGNSGFKVAISRGYCCFISAIILWPHKMPKGSFNVIYQTNFIREHWLIIFWWFLRAYRSIKTWKNWPIHVHPSYP